MRQDATSQANTRARSGLLPDRFSGTGQSLFHPIHSLYYGAADLDTSVLRNGRLEFRDAISLPATEPLRFRFSGPVDRGPGTLAKPQRHQRLDAHPGLPKTTPAGSPAKTGKPGFQAEFRQNVLLFRPVRYTDHANPGHTQRGAGSPLFSCGKGNSGNGQEALCRQPSVVGIFFRPAANVCRVWNGGLRRGNF